ncbi:hypothetical protein BCR34DRAFT_486145 [Clohesyomyces aquaticus]|uniref:CBF1-interacting co-repressor CIR N-terminal domain-containing protein n=1 Tax=Clohesyomyces aquaticus TaxID=1231657 RepID=A0A1Y1ZJG5_9PLEO|nr:hypothetical protein BCR34DRAFT_486145 [Clohesyomyces aquaticus]
MLSHLLGKKSWNVYNPANIAKVKADEAAAAAREAAEELRMQELDAERRAAILRGQTPPPLPVADAKSEERPRRTADKGTDGHDRKRRRLAGEDDTDRDIRLAAAVTGPKDDDSVAVLKLRKPALDAPLTDHAGNINLFPVDHKEARKREKNAEAEKEKKKKEQAFEDQYTMRFSNAAGRSGLERPWYAESGSKASKEALGSEEKMLECPSKDVWGREDPRRKEREQARISSSDPLAFMNKAQMQLKRSREDKKKFNNEREKELRELRAQQERAYRRERHGKRKKREDDDLESFSLDDGGCHERRRRERERSSSHRHRHEHRNRSRSRERKRKRNHEHDLHKVRHDHRSRSPERRPERNSTHS